MPDDALETLLDGLRKDATAEMIERILTRWRCCEDAAASTSILKKAQRQVQDSSIDRDRRVALTFLLSEMLHDDPEVGGLG